MNRIAVGLIAGAMAFVAVACSHHNRNPNYVGGGPSGQENLYPTEYNAPAPYGGNTIPVQTRTYSSGAPQSTGGGPSYAPPATPQSTSTSSGVPWYENAR